MTALRVDEAAQLLPPLLASVADGIGARVLLIKGSVPEVHGLREAKTSGDVDLLVEPSGYDALVERLHELGWRTGLSAAADNARYAGALRHEIWPLEVDLHRAYPGFVAREDEVFEALWSDRATIELGAREVPCAGWAGSVLIGALHALRNPVEGTNRLELRMLAAAVAGAPDELPVQLRRLAAATGAGVSAGVVLEWPGLSPTTAMQRLDEHVAAWDRGAAAGVVRGVTWLLALRGAPLRRWPALFVRALLGSGETSVRATYPDAPLGRRGLWLARWWRLRDVVRQIPGAARAIWHQRRSRSAG